MSYTPINSVIYTNAFAGALTAMILADKSPLSTNPANYTSQLQAAAAFAQELDTLAAASGGQLPTVVGQLVASACFAVWINRSIPAKNPTDPNTYAGIAKVILAVGSGVGAVLGPIPNLQFPGMVAVSGTDQTVDFLANKLLAGSGVTLAQSAPPDETLTASASGGPPTPPPAFFNSQQLGGVAFIPGDDSSIQLPATAFEFTSVTGNVLLTVTVYGEPVNITATPGVAELQGTFLVDNAQVGPVVSQQLPIGPAGAGYRQGSTFSFQWFVAVSPGLHSFQVNLQMATPSGSAGDNFEVISYSLSGQDVSP